MIRRHMTATAAAIAAAVPMLAPSVAVAQPVPGPISRDVAFRTVFRGEVGGPTRAKQVVITSAAELNAFFGGNPPPFLMHDTVIDYNSEVVLAVAMGQRTSGGHETRITKITHMIGGITGGMAFVHYDETSPSGGISTTVMTAPYHVVRLQKLAARFVFVNDSAAAATQWNEIDLSESNGSAGSSTNLSLKSDGSVRILRSSRIARFAPVEGRATAAELRTVSEAFARADVKTLPPFVPDPRMIAGNTVIDLKSLVPGATYDFKASLDFYVGLTPRVKPLVDALQTIITRVVSNPTSIDFSSITLQTRNTRPPVTTNLSVSSDGTLELTRNRLNVPGGPIFEPFRIQGRATPQELAALKREFAAADVDSLPASLGRMVPDGTTFKLRSAVAPETYETGGFVQSDFGPYESRVRPLLRELLAIEARLSNPAERREVVGIVRDTPATQIVENRSSILEVKNAPFVSLLARMARNKYVRAFGSVTKNGMFGGDVEIEWVEATARHTTPVYAAPPTVVTPAPGGTPTIVIATLRANDETKIIGESFGFYHVKLANGRTGYVAPVSVKIGSRTPIAATPGVINNVPR